MNILALNAGSSSLSYKLFSSPEAGGMFPIAWGKAHHVSVVSSTPSFMEHRRKEETVKEVTPIPDHAAAFSNVLSWLQRHHLPIDAVAHRFVHGGPHFSRAAFIDEKALAALRECLPLAPLHNAFSLQVIDLVFQLLPGIPQAAAFDTAFHASLPEEATTYAIPFELSEKYGLRKTGFHGLSLQAVIRQLQEHRPAYGPNSRLVVCHLGTGGASITAIRDGRPVDTSMGYSTLAGLVMNTRCGDLDPGVVLALLARRKCSPLDLETILARESGLIGLSGVSSDIRDLLPRFRKDPASREGLACRVYLHRLKLYLGAYLALLGGLDMLVFTDSVGLTVPEVRAEVCQNMEWCGIHLDAAKNQAATTETIAELQSPQSAVQILTVPNDEELEIAREAAHLLNLSPP